MPRCPKCKRQCDPIRYEGVRIYNCGPCGGHWMEEARLSVILERREIDMPDPVKREMVRIAEESDSAQQLWCITCGCAMKKDAFKHWPEIQLDYCERCGGIWLDRGELEKCQIYWECMRDHPEVWETNKFLERQVLLDAMLEARRTPTPKRRKAPEKEPERPAAAARSDPFALSGYTADGIGDMLGKMFGRGKR